MPKAQKHSILQCFGSALRVRGGSGRGENSRSNAWCRYRCWWWRWCAQGPTRHHFGCLKSILESLRNKLLSSSDPHQVTLFLHNIFWHAIWHSHFVSFICIVCWHSIWYIFSYSLWLRFDGQNSDQKLWCFCWCCCCCWFVAVAVAVTVVVAVLVVCCPSCPSCSSCSSCSSSSSCLLFLLFFLLFLFFLFFLFFLLLLLFLFFLFFLFLFPLLLLLFLLLFLFLLFLFVLSFLLLLLFLLLFLSLLLPLLTVQFFLSSVVTYMRPHICRIYMTCVELWTCNCIKNYV